MQADLTSIEVEILRHVLEARTNEMLMEIANTDSREYRAMLVEEEGVLQGLLAKLGCVRPEGSPETTCSGG